MAWSKPKASSSTGRRALPNSLRPGCKRYRVSFYDGCRAGQWNCRAPGSTLAYVVLYDYDPASRQGFVYLPGRDDELFQFNHTMWHGNGLEGNWFRARPEWDSYVSTRIANARAGGPCR